MSIKQASTDKFTKYIFCWTDDKGENECVLYDRTPEEALTIAKSMGFVENKWYRPSTWDNHMIVIG